MLTQCTKSRFSDTQPKRFLMLLLFDGVLLLTIWSAYAATRLMETASIEGEEDTKVSRRWSQKNNRGFVLGKEAFAASSLNNGFGAGVESLVGLYGESPLEHYSTSFWTSLSVSFQTIRVCSFQNNKRKKNYKITKPLNLLKIFGVSKVTLFEGINSV